MVQKACRTVPEETPTAETLTLEGPVFTDAGQAQELKEILERDGKQYRLGFPGGSARSAREGP